VGTKGYTKKVLSPIKSNFLDTITEVSLTFFILYLDSLYL